MASGAAFRDDARMLTRQAAYRRRKRNGFEVLRVTVDPQDVRELLRACGLTPTSDDTETLAEGLRMVVEMHSAGELTLIATK